MDYIHPKHYKGLELDTPNSQDNVRARVESYCLKCDVFVGKEHDFSKCQTFNKLENGKIIHTKTCPFPYVIVSVIQPRIRCNVEKD